MYDVIVIGAGPAGLTSALYLLRANKKVLILETKSYGGQIINASKVENYPGFESISGYELATNLYNQVIKLGCEIKYETVIRINEDKSVVTNNDSYKASAIIIATGAKNRKLNLENETKYIGKGISYCATCDGNFYKGKVVAVNGGGNTALEDAIYLSDIADTVYLIHRRDSFRGEQKYIDEIKNRSNIKLLLDSTIIKINGEEKLTEIVVEDKKNNLTNLKIDGLFIAIGQEPTNEMFSNVVDLENGYIKTIDDVHTKTEGIYVAGDTRTKYLRQLTTAISDGSIAASVAIKELK